ncbi:hypothetical protein EYV94_26650 [Puteibacter caeruleilacunae]|nr:hypothetical protein EYV94_26650 [Puteibacter caeruleilacunae]
MLRNKGDIFSVIAALIVMITSCSEMDDNYEQFIDSEPTVYLHKVDSARVRSGRNRVQFEILPNIDKRVEGYRIFYNFGEDSIDTSIPGADEESLAVIIDELDEGIQTFEVVSIGEKELRSLPAEFISSIYGEIYESRLSNRFIKSKEFNENELEIGWGDTHGEYAIEIMYTDLNGEKITYKQETPFEESILENVNKDKPVSYRTVYKPNELAVDLFYADEIVLSF